MKKILFSLTVAGLIFAGCSSKAPEVSSVETQSNLEVKPIYFDFDKFNIRDDQWGQSVENTLVVNQGETQSQRIILEGNADHWGSGEYNFALGVKRAKAVKDQMVGSGVNADRFEINSNGESKPVCTENTKECDQLNRRVDIILE